jgi:hypothetical protein
VFSEGLILTTSGRFDGNHPIVVRLFVLRRPLLLDLDVGQFALIVRKVDFNVLQCTPLGFGQEEENVQESDAIDNAVQQDDAGQRQRGLQIVVRFGGDEAHRVVEAGRDAAGYAT